MVLSSLSLWYFCMRLVDFIIFFLIVEFIWFLSYIKKERAKNGCAKNSKSHRSFRKGRHFLWSRTLNFVKSRRNKTKNNNKKSHNFGHRAHTHLPCTCPNASFVCYVQYGTLFTDCLDGRWFLSNSVWFLLCGWGELSAREFVCIDLSTMYGWRFECPIDDIQFG